MGLAFYLYWELRVTQKREKREERAGGAAISAWNLVGIFKKGLEGWVVYFKFVLRAVIKLLLMSTERGLFGKPTLLVKAVVSCLNQLVDETPISGE
jgi:hypothetical protein